MRYKLFLFLFLFASFAIADTCTSGHWEWRSWCGEYFCTSWKLWVCDKYAPDPIPEQPKAVAVESGGKINPAIFHTLYYNQRRRITLTEFAIGISPCHKDVKLAPVRITPLEER